MGGAASQSPNTSTRLSVDNLLSEKEYIFLLFQREIDTKIINGNYKDLHQIEKDISCHIKDLKCVIKHKKNYVEIVDRAQRLIKNYELSLAKIRSIFSTISRKKRHKRHANGINGLDNPTYHSISKMTPRNSKVLEEVNYENDMYISKDDISGQLEGWSETISFPESDISSIPDEPAYANVEYLDLPLGKNKMSNLENGRVNVKPPMANPSTTIEELLVSEVPNYYKRLNEIFEKSDLGDEDIEEVLSMKRIINEIGNIFNKNIDELLARHESKKKSEVKIDTSIQC